MSAFITQPLNRSSGNRANLTYQSTITNLPNGSQTTPYFVLPDGCIGWTVDYVTSGAGSLQMSQSCNDDREALATGQWATQMWINVGTAATAGTPATTGSQQPVCMIRGVVTGGSGTDTVTITICASFIKS